MDERDVVVVAEQLTTCSPRWRASGRDRRRRRSAGRRSPRGSARRRRPNRRRPRGRRSPCPCRPARGFRRSWSARNSAMVQSPASAADCAHEVGDQLAPSGVWTTSGWNWSVVAALLVDCDHGEGGASDVATMRKPGQRGHLVAVAHPHLMGSAGSPGCRNRR
jgi:hypothetical protein